MERELMSNNVNTIMIDADDDKGTGMYIHYALRTYEPKRKKKENKNPCKTSYTR